jgi:hypothetical protein
MENLPSLVVQKSPEIVAPYSQNYLDATIRQVSHVSPVVTDDLDLLSRQS